MDEDDDSEVKRKLDSFYPTFIDNQLVFICFDDVALGEDEELCGPASFRGFSLYFSIEDILTYLIEVNEHPKTGGLVSEDVKPTIDALRAQLVRMIIRIDGLKLVDEETARKAWEANREWRASQEH